MITNEWPTPINKLCVAVPTYFHVYCISLKQRLVRLAEGNDDAQAPVIMRVEKALVNVKHYMEGRCALLCTWYLSCRCLCNGLLPTTHFHKASAYESQLSRTLTVSYQVVIVQDGAFHQVVQIFTGKKNSSTSHSKTKGHSIATF